MHLRGILVFFTWSLKLDTWEKSQEGTNTVIFHCRARHQSRGSIDAYRLIYCHKVSHKKFIDKFFLPLKFQQNRSSENLRKLTQPGDISNCKFFLPGPLVTPAISISHEDVTIRHVIPFLSFENQTKICLHSWHEMLITLKEDVMKLRSYMLEIPK